MFVQNRHTHSHTHTHTHARARTLSHTIFHRTPSFTHNFHRQFSNCSILHHLLCLCFVSLRTTSFVSPLMYFFFTRNIVTPIFHTHLCHTPSFTHNFNTYNSSHATFSLIDHPPPPLSILPCPSLWNFMFLLIVQLRTPAMPFGLGAFVAAKLKTLCWQHKFEPGWYSREAEGPEQRR